MNEEKFIKLATEIVGEDTVEEYLNMNKETVNQDPNQAECDEDVFDSETYYLDTGFIRVRMKERNLTLKQLQEQVGVAYRTAARWLAGQEFPRTQNFKHLAEVLEVEPHELVTKRSLSPREPIDDDLRFVQRRIEKIVSEILNDEDTPNEKKVDALVKFHGALVRARKVIDR